MTKLFKNGKVVNVFTASVEEKNVLVEGNRIIGIGDYKEADEIIDLKGRYLCPSFIDAHVHVESSLVTPIDFSYQAVMHGTCAMIIDPHEIVNTSGLNGFKYMRKLCDATYVSYFMTIPSCVPASPLDPSSCEIKAEDMEEFLLEDKVIALGEVMNYPAVINNDPEIMAKLAFAKKHNLIINGHAPRLMGADLDKYISKEIYDEHECDNLPEAMEKLAKGVMIFIREGTSAKNLEALISLFDEPYYHRCCLVCDDIKASDIYFNGHINRIIAKAVKLGKDPIKGIIMATLNPAMHYHLNGYGAIAPGYYANMCILENLNSLKVDETFYMGESVFKLVGGKPEYKIYPGADKLYSKYLDLVVSTFNVKPLKKEDLYIEPKSNKVRVIGVQPGLIVTDYLIEELDFAKNNGIDVERDIIKIAVYDRYHEEDSLAKGFVKGLGIKHGAIASSIAHDSHNLIIAGDNDEDMVLAANIVIESKGGIVLVHEGEVYYHIPLTAGGLMYANNIEMVIPYYESHHQVDKVIGKVKDIDIYMHLAFVSLPVIPSLKLTARGLVDVTTQSYVDLFVE